MAFCSNCGSKIIKDKSYCDKCNEKIRTDQLTDEAINNQNSYTNKSNDDKKINLYPTTVASNLTASTRSKEYLDLGNVLKSMLISPLSSVNKFMDKLNKKNTVSLFLSLTVIQGFFSVWFFKQIFLISNTSISNILSKPFNFPINDIGIYYKIPYRSILLHGIILLYIAISILYVGIFLVFKGVHKAKISSFKICKGIILSIIPVLGGELLFLLASYINIILAIILLLMSIFIFFYTFVLSIRKYMDVPLNPLVFNIAAIFSLMLFIVVFGSFVFLKIDIHTLLAK